MSDIMKAGRARVAQDEPVQQVWLAGLESF